MILELLLVSRYHKGDTGTEECRGPWYIPSLSP